MTLPLLELDLSSPTLPAINLGSGLALNPLTPQGSNPIAYPETATIPITTAIAPTSSQVLTEDQLPSLILSQGKAQDLVTAPQSITQAPTNGESSPTVIETIETSPPISSDIPNTTPLEPIESQEIPPEAEEEARAPLYGWYLGLSGSYQNREQATEANASSQGNTFFVFAPGISVNGAVGYRLEDFRVEAEYSFFNNGIDIASANGLRQAGFAPAAASGDVNLYAYMVNFYYDIPLDNSRWKPYVGLGLGFYKSQINGATASFFNIPSLGVDIPAVNATSNNMPFAYQIRAGIGYEVSRNAEIYLGYRYFHGEQLEFTSPGLGTFNPNGANVHNIELGIRALL
ncbi:MAG: outer membrane protein [Microcystaceae cyanobacterium]